VGLIASFQSWGREKYLNPARNQTPNPELSWLSLLGYAGNINCLLSQLGHGKGNDVGMYK
jgi:hypothetical protein